MIGVDVDPAIFAFGPNLNADEIRSRIAFIAEWSRFLGRNNWPNIHISPSGHERLRNGGFLPAHAPVAAALASAGIRHAYSPEDVIRPVLQLLQRCLATAHCCVTDELHSNFESSLAKPWSAILGVDAITEHSLVLSGLEREIHSDGRLANLLSYIQAPNITFSSRIDVVEPDDLAGFTENELPKKFASEANIVREIEAFLESVSPELVWSTAAGSSEIKMAIRLKCRQRMLVLGTYDGMDSIPGFFVGSSFFDSLARNQATEQGRYAEQTLDCCASAVLELPILEVKSFNKNPRKMDGAVPLRAHITSSGVGIRLMMWKRPATKNQGEALEFANIGPKHEEEIVYCDPKDAV